jgi:general secretion pathway protein D
VAVLRPLISANNTINASPGNNSLVITDYAENLQRIAKIIAALDQPAATDIEIIPLQHVVASDIAQVVQRLADGGGPVVAVPGGGRRRCDHGAGRPAHQFADRARRATRPSWPP